MNKNKLKSYAPAARRDFIQAVTDRAHFFGLSEKEIIPVEESGDVAIIGGRPFPRNVATQRKKLEERIKCEGFNQVMEGAAYTWFNRFLALRYMELHGYLEHGFRVLSNAGSGTIPEIIEHAAELDLPGLNRQKVVELKLDGGKDAELYRMLLVAQCNALHAAMPFLFEKIDDETELLLPDNLLHSDSLIRKLVTEIEEEDWQEVEIIGWLYQFYISEKKDQVIGKVVKSEDIPAATQLFTPNWIVKYMVQNSLGRKWLATYHDSPLKAKMAYYIEPAEQTDEVKAQLAAITPDSLDPETLTLLDPACGSGHILVVAYDILKEIYLERGYSSRDFPRLILEKNLFGLDIDDRAAQMAGFALLMKARKDDRKILKSDYPVKLNIMAIQESGGIAFDKAHWGEHANAICDLIDLFKHGKTFGSLIQVPEIIAAKQPVLEETVRQTISSGDMLSSQTARELEPLVKQAKMLAGKYDCVVANPPYMGGKGMNGLLGAFLKDNYADVKSDLFSGFIVRNAMLAHPNGQLGFMTPFVWMFISSYEKLRSFLIGQKTITSLVQLEYSGFDGATVPICTFTLENSCISNFKGGYVRLSDFRGAENQAPKTLEAIKNPGCGWFFRAAAEDFSKIPGSPIAYWLPRAALETLDKTIPLGKISEPRKGMCTRDNDYFVRLWGEVSFNNIGFDCSSRDEAKATKRRWFPYQKGGEFRQWYGNHNCLVDWEKDGYRLLNMETLGWKGNSTNHNLEYIFKPAIVWSKITSAIPNFRYSPSGFLYDDASGLCSINDKSKTKSVLGFLCSKVGQFYMGVINPTLNIQPGNMVSMPYLAISVSNIDAVTAYSAASRPAIPMEVGHPFRLIPATP